jgi:hypothetical protein
VHGQARSHRDVVEILLRHVDQDPEAMRIGDDEQRGRRIRPHFLARVEVALDDQASHGADERKLLVDAPGHRPSAVPQPQAGGRSLPLGPRPLRIRLRLLEVLPGRRAALIQQAHTHQVALGSREVGGGAGRVGLRLTDVGRGQQREELALPDDGAEVGVDPGHAPRYGREDANRRVLVPHQAPGQGDVPVLAAADGLDHHARGLPGGEGEGDHVSVDLEGRIARRRLGMVATEPRRQQQGGESESGPPRRRAPRGCGLPPAGGHS